MRALVALFLFPVMTGCGSPAPETLDGVAASQALDSDGHWTWGDVQALINDYPPGGGTLWDRLWPGLDIRPFPVYDDVVYCVDDWHVLAYRSAEAAVYQPMTDECAWCVGTLRQHWIFYSPDEAAAWLDETQVEFFLDRERLDDFDRSPMKKLIVEDMPSGPVFVEECGCEATFVDAFAVQWTRVLEPGELPVGRHTFKLHQTTFPGGEWEYEWITQSRFKVYSHDDAH